MRPSTCRRAGLAAALGVVLTAGVPSVPSGAAPRPARASGPRPPHVTTVVPGIRVWAERWTTPDGRPERSSLMTVNLTRTTIHADVYSAYGVVNGPYLPLSRMMLRTGAVAGVNGDFFQLGTDRGTTVGGIVRSGSIWKTPQRGFAANLVVRPDGTAAIGSAPVTGSVRVRRGVARPLTSVNAVPDALSGAITMITPVMAGVDLPTGCALAVGTAGSAGHLTITRMIASIPRRYVLRRLLAPQRALLGCRSAGTWMRTTLRPRLAVTATVGFSGGPVRALISGAQVLLRAGAPYVDPNGRVIQGAHAETFACVSKDARHLLLGTVDQRDWRTEAGVTMGELRTYLRGKGCWDAMAFDGGGSSTLDYRLPSWSGVAIANHPADGQERLIPDALLLSAS